MRQHKQWNIIQKILAGDLFTLFASDDESKGDEFLLLRVLCNKWNFIFCFCFFWFLVCVMCGVWRDVSLMVVKVMETVELNLVVGLRFVWFQWQLLENMMRCRCFIFRHLVVALSRWWSKSSCLVLFFLLRYFSTINMF